MAKIVHIILIHYKFVLITPWLWSKYVWLIRECICTLTIFQYVVTKNIFNIEFGRSSTTNIKNRAKDRNTNHCTLSKWCYVKSIRCNDVCEETLTKYIIYVHKRKPYTFVKALKLMFSLHCDNLFQKICLFL